MRSILRLKTYCAGLLVAGGCSVASAANCPGDLDRSGAADLTDLSILLSHFGETGVQPSMGDMDGDGSVTLTDLARLLTVFGLDCDDSASRARAMTEFAAQDMPGTLPDELVDAIVPYLIGRGGVIAALDSADAARNVGNFDAVVASIDAALGQIERAINIAGSVHCDHDVVPPLPGCQSDAAMYVLGPIRAVLATLRSDECQAHPLVGACNLAIDDCPSCSKLDWIDVPLGTGTLTNTEPALLVRGGRAHLAVVSTTGQILVVERNVKESIEFNAEWAYGDNWEAWTAPIIPANAPNPGFNNATPPVLVRMPDSNDVYLLARGGDNNVYASVRNANAATGSGWGPWIAITNDQSCIGRIDAAFTFDNVPQPDLEEVHLVYHSSISGLTRIILRGNTTPVDRLELAIPVGAGFIPAIASDEKHQVMIVAATPGATTTGKAYYFSRTDDFAAAATYSAPTLPSPWTGFNWTGKADVAFSNQEFQAVFGITTGQGVQHVPYGIRSTGFVDYSRGNATLPYSTDFGPAIIDYRSKPIVSYPAVNNALRYFRCDMTDRITPPTGHWYSPWIQELAKSNITAASRPALSTDAVDVYAAIRDTTGRVRFILLTRSIAYKRIRAQGITLVFSDEDGNGSQDFGGFTASPYEMPIASDIAYATWLTPEWVTDRLMPDYVEAGGLIEPGGEFFELGAYPVRIHATEQLNAAYFGNGIHIDAGMWWSPFLEEYYHKFGQALAISSTCPDESSVCGYGEQLEPEIHILETAFARVFFSTDVGCCYGDAARAPGFLGVGSDDTENYDNTTDEHSWLYALLYYFKNPGTFRSLAQTDAQNGNNLLQNKYNWMRDVIYNGVEFDETNVVQLAP